MKFFAVLMAASTLLLLSYPGEAFLNPVVDLGVAYCTAPSSIIPEGLMVSVLKAYVDWHSSRNGLFRYRLLMESYDSDPGEAIERLKKRGARMVVGFPFSQQAIGAAAAANRLEIPALSIVASTPELTGKDDWFFRIREDFSRETELMAKWIDSVGIRKVVAIWSGGNDAYAVESVKSILSLSSADLAGSFRFPEDCDLIGERGLSDPDGVAIYADPSVSYWAVQYAMDKWPQASLILSRWSLFENHDYITAIKGLRFVYAESYDPDEEPPGDFADYWKKISGVGFTITVRYTYGAMAFISRVFRDDPGLSGRDLRMALSMPRKVDSLGWSFQSDRSGDVLPAAKLYIFENGLFEEVLP